MKKLGYMVSFALGVSSFVIAQPLLRMSFLKVMFGPTGLLWHWMLVPWLAVLLLAFSAGLFEESVRLLWRMWFYREPLRHEGKALTGRFGHAMAFGLGHGLCEAVMLLWPLLALYPLSHLQLALFERALAVLLHMGLTAVIFYGAQRGRPLRYYALALGVHTLVDVLALAMKDPVWTYGLLMVILVCLWCAVYQWKKEWL